MISTAPNLKLVNILFEKCFVPKIELGIKRHSIRLPRKRPIRVGDFLSLRFWEDLPYRSKQVVIFGANCTAIIPISIGLESISFGEGTISTRRELDSFAASDGFENWKEMCAFRHFRYKLPFEGLMIQWDFARRVLPDGAEAVDIELWKDLLAHALGTTSFKRRMHGARNHFCADVGGDHFRQFKLMEAKGLVRPGVVINDGSSQYFHATLLGCRFACLSSVAIGRVKARGTKC